MKKILMILTSHSSLINTDSKTGVWLEEFTDPFYDFKDAGFETTLASVKGGEPPIDPTSALTENITASNRRYQDDEILQNQFKTTKKISEVQAADYDALFISGGHGPLFDLSEDAETGKLIIDFYNAGKYVTAVCHGSAAFIAAENHQNGFLKNKNMTCFSNIEEKLVGKTDQVPYLLEDKLNSLGAKIENAIIPFNSNVKLDGFLITGQNPLSAGAAAKELIKKIG
ncbi:type 1 glutamine amidotransferase domain-containing protein [Halpernia frigidisoli]|uniref:Putative intracellular protease/amidase n=1 Tax=Halpernia frigidisoli TaxID=1125876 RepID=A0A1I3IVC2_9FLAO|nr:type 1 glutamine amidotransferase domain-containing protein [Halpernia frigidisoli]SFI51876.1 Putative intracellular protease/amidase [Halpernia frigidisoli]